MMFGAGAALAQPRRSPALESRPSTLTMSCRQARTLVESRGAIVLATGRLTYDRFVAHGGLCSLGEIAEPAFEPSAETAQCFVGYRCVYRRNEPPSGEGGGGTGGGMQ
jgi:hypothetical protein